MILAIVYMWVVMNVKLLVEIQSSSFLYSMLKYSGRQKFIPSFEKCVISRQNFSEPGDARELYFFVW
jgi:hypothetical protein